MKRISFYKRFFKDYYLNTFLGDCHRIQRSFVTSASLLIIRQIYYTLTLFSAQITQKLEDNDFIFGYFYLDIKSKMKQCSWIIYLILIFHISFFLSLVFCIIEYHIKFKFSQLRPFFSGVFKIYNYVLVYPIIMYDIAVFDTSYIALCNIITAIIYSLVITVHDIDYCIRAKDFLIKRSPMVWSFILTLMEILFAVTGILINSEELYFVLIVGGIFGILRILDILVNRPYQDIKISQLELFNSLIHSTFCLIILLCLMTSFQLSLFLFMITLIPICYKSAGLLIFYQYDISEVYTSQNNQKRIDSVNAQEFDFLMRSLWNNIPTSYEKYRTNSSSFVLENLYYVHQLNCERFEHCSICQNSANVEINEAYLDGRNRQKFLIGYIIHQYRSYLGSNKFKKGKSDNYAFIYFSYINFLVEIEQSKVLSFVELIRLKEKFNLSLRESAIQQQIFIKLRKIFEAFNSREQNLQNQQKGNLNENSKEKQIDSEQQNYFIGIQFDEEINRAETRFYNTLKIKETLLHHLCNDLINLLEMKQTAEKYLKEKEEVKLMLLQLAKINYYSQKLQFYMESYVTYLGFGENKRRLFNKKAFRSEQYYSDTRRNRGNMSIDYSIFDKDNCVIFITLIDKIGTVKRVQNKFFNIFGYLEKETIGKNIDMIMPSQIAKVHDLILLNFISQGSSGKDFLASSKAIDLKIKNKYNQKQESKIQKNQISSEHEHPKNYIPLLLARNSKGWGIPIQLRFKTDYIDLTDCGLTGHLKVINKDFQYVMTSSKYFQVHLMSQQLFERILQKYIPQNELTSMYLNRVLPILHYFTNQTDSKWTADNTENNQILKTIAFLPKNEIFSQKSMNYSAKKSSNPLFEKLSFSNLKANLSNYSLESYDMFLVKMKFYSQQSEMVNYNIIEIQQIRKISTPDSQKENLIMFKNQMKTMLDIDYDISNDLEILKKLEQLTFIQHQLTYHEQGGEDQSFLSNFSLDEDAVVSVDEQQQQQEDAVFINILQTENQLNNKQDNQFVDTSKLNNKDQNHVHYQQIDVIQQHQDVIQSHQDTYQHIGEDFNNESKLALESSRRLFNQSHIFDLTNRNLDTTQRENKAPNHWISQDQSASNLKSTQNLNVENHFQSSLLDTLRGEGIEGRLENYAKIYDHQNSASTNINNVNSHFSQIYHTEEKQRSKADMENEFNHIDSPQTQNNQTIVGILTEKLKQLKQYGKTMKKHAKEISTQNLQAHENLESVLNEQPQISNKMGKSTKQVKHLYRNISNQLSSQFSSQNLNNNNQNENQQLAQKQLLTFLSQYNNIPYQLNNNKLSWQNMEYDEEQMNRRKEAINFMENDEDFQNKAHFCGSGIAVRSSDYNSDSLQQKQDKYYKELEERSRILDASSVKTGQTKNYEQKRNVRKLIITDKKDFSLILLNIFGFLSIGTIIALTIYQFANIKQLFMQASDHIADIPWPNTLRSYFSGPFYYSAIKYISLSQFFPDPSLLDPQFLLELKNNSQNYFNQSLVLLQEYERAGTSGKQYFQYINTNKVPFVYSIDDKSVPSSAIYSNVPKYKVNINMTLESFLFRLVAQTYYFYKTEGLDPSIQKLQLDNFGAFSSNLTQVQTIVQQQSSDVLTNIVNNVQTLMIVVITVSFSLIFTIFPLYYFVQFKNQEVLRLLSTLTPLSLSQMLRQIQVALYLQTQTVNEQSISKDKTNKLKNDSVRKRKNISQTTNIPKFQLSLFCVCLFSFALIIIQPIVNTVLVGNYNNEAQINISLLGQLYNLRVQCFSNVVVSFKYIQAKVTPHDTTYNVPYYLARVKALVTTTNAQVLGNVSSIIEQSQMQSKSQQSLYDSFLYKIFDSDICGVLQKYPEYLTAETTLDFNECRNINSGVFTQGFQISIKKFLSLFTDLYSIFQITDNTQMLSSLKTWGETQRLKDFYYYFEYLQKIIIVQKDFMLDVMKKDLDVIQNIQVILLVFQISQLVFLFSFAWLKFYLYVSKEMLQIRRILTVVSIDSVIENPYFISYLTKR